MILSSTAYVFFLYIFLVLISDQKRESVNVLLDSGAFGRRDIRCKWDGGGRMSLTKL